MQCYLGNELIRQYDAATNDREVGRDILLTSSARQYKVEDAPFEDLMTVANQRYGDAFVALVTHTASCAACRDEPKEDDQVRFASV